MEKYEEKFEIEKEERKKKILKKTKEKLFGEGKFIGCSAHGPCL